MASNNDAGELVRVLRNTCHKADFDAVTRVLSARERRAAETEAQLQAELAEIDAHRGAASREEDEDSARLRRIVDDANAQLQAALGEIRAAQKKHNEQSARLRRIADEAEAEHVAALGEIRSAQKKHDEESARLAMIADTAEAKLAYAFSEIHALRQKRVAPSSQAPQDEADEMAHLGIATLCPTPTPVPIQQDEQRVVEEEMEVSLERVWMEEEGGVIDGSGVSLERKADAVEEQDIVPPIQIQNELQEKMVATTTTGVALQNRASHTTGEKEGPSKLRAASVGVTVSKRGKSVETSEQMSLVRTVLQEIEKKMSVARGKSGLGRGHRRGRGRGRGRGRDSLDKPVPAAPCSNFRCWLISPSPVPSSTVIGGADTSVVAPLDPPLVDGSKNRSDTQVQNNSEDEQDGKIADNGFASALHMLASAADASDSPEVTTNLEKDATLQKCLSRTNTVEAPGEARSVCPFVPPNADARVCSIYNNGAISGSDQLNRTTGHQNVGTKKLGLVLGTSSPVFCVSEEKEIRHSFEENRMSRFPSLSIHDISGAQMLNMMGKTGNCLSVAVKLGKCVENKRDTCPKKYPSTSRLGKGVDTAGEGSSHDGEGVALQTTYMGHLMDLDKLEYWLNKKDE